MRDKHRNKDIEKMLNQENREKKMIARGARHNSGRRGGGSKGITGAMRMPSDVLKYSDKKAYKKYVKASVVTMSSIYEEINNIPSLLELREMEFSAASNILTIAKKHNTTEALKKHLNVASGTLYTIFDEFNVLYEKRGKRIKKIEEVPIEKLSNMTEQISTSFQQYREDTIKEKAKRIAEEQETREIEYDKKKEADLIIATEKEKELARDLQEKADKDLQQAIDRKVFNDRRESAMLKATRLVEEQDTSKEEGFTLSFSKKLINGKELEAKVVNCTAILDKSKNYSIQLIIKELD